MLQKAYVKNIKVNVYYPHAELIYVKKIKI